MSERSLSAPPHVIFDFDGTIADSLEVVIGCYNSVAPLLRVRRVELANLAHLRSLTAAQALREHDVALWKLPLIVYAVRVALRGQLRNISPFPEIPEVLRALHAAGCRCSILSTNSRPNIERFLAQQGLSMFEAVAGGTSMFGKGRALRRWLRRSSHGAGPVYYVGDELRDIHAAKQAGVQSIAVGWGYAGRESLAAAGPDHLIDRPSELLALLAPGV